jgi:hypothetical protein
MDWPNERYVRIYIRDTPDWVTLSWDARCVFLHLMRKVDRSGTILVGRSGLRGLAASMRAPVEVVQRGLEAEDGLLADGCVVAIEGGYQIRNYVPAQEAKASDRQRKQEQRERERAGQGNPPGDTSGQTVTPPVEAGRTVTKRDIESLNVTPSHAESPPVTIGHSEPSLAEPSQEKISNSGNTPPPLQPETARAPGASGGDSSVSSIGPETPLSATGTVILEVLTASSKLKSLATPEFAGRLTRFTLDRLGQPTSAKLQELLASLKTIDETVADREAGNETINSLAAFVMQRLKGGQAQPGGGHGRQPANTRGGLQPFIAPGTWNPGGDQ